jgi:hypothetical protein
MNIPSQAGKTLFPSKDSKTGELWRARLGQHVSEEQVKPIVAYVLLLGEASRKGKAGMSAEV